LALPTPRSLRRLRRRTRRLHRASRRSWAPARVNCLSGDKSSTSDSSSWALSSPSSTWRSTRTRWGRSE
jgi:hypothetical protein